MEQSVGCVACVSSSLQYDTSMQLCRVKDFGLMSTILHPDPLRAPSVFLGAIWISHTVNAGMTFGSEGWSRCICARRWSSSQKLRTFPLRISNVRSSLRDPFSILLPPFSNEYILMTAPVSDEADISEIRFVITPVWFFLYGTADHPDCSGRMMVMRCGIFLFPL